MDAEQAEPQAADPGAAQLEFRYRRIREELEHCVELLGPDLVDSMARCAAADPEKYLGDDGLARAFFEAAAYAGSSQEKDVPLGRDVGRWMRSRSRAQAQHAGTARYRLHTSPRPRGRRERRGARRTAARRAAGIRSGQDPGEPPGVDEDGCRTPLSGRAAI